ncbi:hypothetical protein PU560_09640 [Georgenia sp. 10Sc9-8]|uniref:Uncharacterized protein n=1 Tax=Georgenia halotolerans TaxID=3028317 RepID=A0ABT5U0R7_9MICO|nr:hypothetical protein [Georgenia halotolerans]
MNTDLAFPDATAPGPTRAEIRRAQEILSDVLGSTVDATRTEVAFVTGALAALTWVLGDAGDDA